MIPRKHIAAALLLTSAFAAAPAAAGPLCKAVHGRFTLQAFVDGCASPVGICAAGTYDGGIQAHSDFVGSSLAPTVDTAATGVVLLTGDNAIHTRNGDLFTKDAIVLATTGAGEFAEVDTIVGGTGEYAGASGRLTATGTFAGGAGVGSFVGEICWP